MFYPPLPLHKLHSIQREGFGTNNKIFVEFETPWWDADCEVIYFLWEDEVSFLIINGLYLLDKHQYVV